MLKNLIGKYKKRRREEISNPTPSSSSSSSTSTSTSTSTSSSDSASNNSNIASVLFHCREGSVTHYYHFFFGALVPLIEYHLANPSKVLRILTDVGPFKSILCELPITISDLLGPNLSLKGHFHDDKSLNQMKQIGEVSLKGYDCFNNEFFNTSFFPKPPKATIQAIQKFFHDSIPFYIAELPTYDVILIQRAQDVYYQTGGCADRDKIYQTSGSERRSITNHVDLVNALRAQCNEMGKTFCNISLERTSVYYQYHMFSKAKVVIAQHGAALANIFFMAYNRSSVKSSNEKLDGDISSKVTRITSSQPAVIEISPPWSREFDHFKNLAAHCEVAHSALPQEEDHSEVDIPAVVTLVRSALEVI